MTTEPVIRMDQLASTADHYENFPVASMLVPARLRPDIANVYRFARYADDIADEGNAPPDQRLAELRRLGQAVAGQASHPIVEPLRASIDRHQIPITHFQALLSAFSQDAAGKRYPDRSSVMDYCSRSADPVGRIVLRIFDTDRHDRIASSDAICSALQLINFVQDIGQDTERGRCYLPIDECQSLGVDDDQLKQCVASRRISPAVRQLLDYQCQQANVLLANGPDLLGVVPLRLRLELAAVIAGGHTMLRRVQSSDPFANRLKLGKTDLPIILKTASGILTRGKLK